MAWKSIIIRNPKTGGSSVMHSLMPKLSGMCYLESNTSIRERLQKLQKGIENNATCIMMGGGFSQFYFKKTKLMRLAKKRGYVTVGFMRNPFDRFISSWAFAIMRGWISDISPVEFCKIIIDENYTNIPKEHIHQIKHHTQLQTLNLYFNDKFQIDYVIRFEYLNSDYKRLAELLGVDSHLEHHNKTKHETWRYYYDKYPDLKQLVEQIYKTDLEKLPYSKNCVTKLY